MYNCRLLFTEREKINSQKKDLRLLLACRSFNSFLGVHCGLASVLVVDKVAGVILAGARLHLAGTLRRSDNSFNGTNGSGLSYIKDIT